MLEGFLKPRAAQDLHNSGIIPREAKVRVDTSTPFSGAGEGDGEREPPADDEGDADREGPASDEGSDDIVDYDIEGLGQSSQSIQHMYAVAACPLVGWPKTKIRGSTGSQKDERKIDT